MAVLFPKALHREAQESLRCADFDHRRLALLHTGAAAGFSLLLTVLNFILTQQMDNAGGLSGLGLRAVLSTAQSVLSILAFAVIPFWEIGFTNAGLMFARREQVRPGTLLEGFRRWGGVLRLTLLRFAVYMAIMLLCLQVASVIYTFTPFSVPVMEAMLSMVETGIAPDAAAVQALLPAMIPMYVILGILLCLVLIPTYYRLRMAELALLDSERPAALPALISSWRLMGKNRLALFRLDLSFWWYYVLLALSSLVGYGDVLLAALGAALPISADAAFFLFYMLHIVCQLGIAWLVGSKISTAYAVAYDTLVSAQTPPAEQSRPAQQ